MSDHTLLVNFNGKEDSWTLTPRSVSLRRRGWIIFRREPGSFWSFLSVQVTAVNDNRKADWPFRVADDGSAIWLFDPHNHTGDYRYTLTVVDGYGEHTSPATTPVPEEDPPIIKNDGSAES